MEMVFDGRYVIMMMTIFSIYTGLIYNEDVDSSWSCTNEPWIVISYFKAIFLVLMRGKFIHLLFYQTL